MTAVTFDTLKLARRLESAGFTREQADGAAEALADSLSNEIATKGDIAELRAEMRSSFNTLDSKLATEIALVRASTAQWIITAVFINTAGLIGAVATVWQLAHR
jgi:hypothetical protein